MAELVLVDGATEVSGPRAALWLLRNWPRLRREMQSTPGCVSHRMWIKWPHTVGLYSYWVTQRDAYVFAHRPEHRRFWRWAARAGHTRGGWLAVYTHSRGGPLWGNGVRDMVDRFGDHLGEPSHEPARQPPPGRGPRVEPPHANR